MVDPGLPDPEDVHLDTAILLGRVVLVTAGGAVLALLQRCGEMLQGVVFPADVIEAEADRAVEKDQQREQRKDALAACSIGTHGERDLVSRTQSVPPSADRQPQKGDPFFSDAPGGGIRSISRLSPLPIPSEP